MGCGNVKSLSINYKNLDYEIETALILFETIPFRLRSTIRISITRLKRIGIVPDIVASISINYKNLDYEIETTSLPRSGHLLALPINYKNLDYEIETDTLVRD